MEFPNEKRVHEALSLAFRYGTIDGGHHKMWVIDQMVRALTGDGYAHWVKEYENKDDPDPDAHYEWDVGIPP